MITASGEAVIFFGYFFKKNSRFPLTLLKIYLIFVNTDFNVKRDNIFLKK